MANIKQAIKRIKQNKKKKMENLIKKSIIKNKIRKINRCLKKNSNLELISKEYKEFESTIDRFSRKGLFHINKSSRYKKKINLKIKNYVLNKKN